MADSVVGVFNRAVSAIGSTEIIASETENSKEAQTCLLWYATARKSVLRAAPWSSARKNRRLALLSTRTEVWANDQPPAPYSYAYVPPNDELAPYHLESYQNFTYRTTVAGNRMLCTNDRDPILYYIFDQDNPGRWDEGLHLAIVYALAAFIAKPLTGSRTTSTDMFDLANELVGQARARAANEERKFYDSMPPELQAAGFSLMAQPRYFASFETFSLGTLGVVG